VANARDSTGWHQVGRVCIRSAFAPAMCYVDLDMDMDRASGAGATCGWSGVANLRDSTGWHQVGRVCI
jgi:hypothetical protein